MKAIPAAVRALDRARKLALIEAGQTLVEYGLLLTLLAMVAVTVLSLVGSEVQALFTQAESDFRNATP
jgi:Flp pilus assembly pilin Flp